MPHGVPDTRPRSRRGVRRSRPDRGRRCRHLLAASGPRRGHWLFRRGGRLAPSSSLPSNVLEATGRIRKGGSVAGEKVAFAVRLPRPVELAGPHLWPGRGARSLFARRTRVPRCLGHGAVPIVVPIVRFPLVLGADARVVCARRPLVRNVPAGRGMASLPAPGTRPAPDHRASGRPSGGLCSPNPFRGSPGAEPKGSRFPDGRLGPAPVPAAGPTGRPDAGRLDSLAAARPEDPTAVLALAHDLLERGAGTRSEEHTSELQSPDHLVC